MYSRGVRQQALGLLATGLSLNVVSKRMGISRAALRDWRDYPERTRGRTVCPRGYDGGDATNLGAGVCHVAAPGAVVVQNAWKHWPCLFPQHGPGRKHERTLGMASWQWEVIEDYPGPFLRGLLHSDGCRVNNWATRMVAGEWKRYDYPRWQFVNASEEIRQWCCDALDLVGVAWRQSGPRTISVSTRAGVARLDQLVGVKS